MKSVQIQSFSWSLFPCIQSKYRKIRTRKNFVFGHFSRSVTHSYSSWEEIICDLFSIVSHIYFTSYADDNTPHVTGENIKEVIEALENFIQRINAVAFKQSDES